MDEQALLAYEAKSNFAVYLGLVHQTDEGKPAIPPQHLVDYVIPAIEDDSLGHTLIVAPPGSAKTNTMIAAAAWWLGQNPSLHVGFICANQDKADERSMAIRNIIENSGAYREVFGPVKPDKTRGWSQSAWYLERPVLMDKNPSLLAAGVGGAIVGARLDRALIDDINDDENTKTENKRNDIKIYLAQSLLTRFQGSRIGRAIGIATRWHEDDASNWMIEQGWHVIVIPALDEEGRSYWPTERPRPKLKCLGEHGEGTCCEYKALGADGFAKQFMGIVSNEESALFKRGNWRRSDDAPFRETSRGAIFVDLAHEEKKEADFTVIAPIAFDGAKFYWEGMIRRRMQFPEAMLAIKGMRGQFPDYPIIIEDTLGAKPLIQTLQRETFGVIGWKIEGRSKIARAQAAAPSHEAGNWFLPNTAWADTVIDEHAIFPSGKHDDTVDVGTMAYLYFARRSGKKRTLKAFTRGWEKVSA